MFNAVRMDIYRLIHTKSAYVILVIAMALAIAMSGMTALVRSMATESIVETTDDVTMVSESDSEIADEYDTASAESLNGPCLLYTSPSPRDRATSRMPSSA